MRDLSEFLCLLSVVGGLCIVAALVDQWYTAHNHPGQGSSIDEAVPYALVYGGSALGVITILLRFFGVINC